MIPLAVITLLLGATVAVIAFAIAPRTVQKRVVFGAEPDRPKPFGASMAWIAIKTADQAAIAETLGIAETVPANWDAGIGTIYDVRLGERYVFLTPPVSGWTLIAGVPLPIPAGRSFVDKLTPLLGALSAEFSDVQYFAAYPDVDFFAWAKLEKGRIVRAFAIGDEGVVWDRGKLTPQEKALGLKLFELRGIRGRSGDAGGAIILHPTEHQVLQMARGWSLDPSRLDTVNAEPATGAIAPAPQTWRAERVRKAAA